VDTLFPFGFPLPTAFYLTLYVVVLLLHVVFMNYVLAGTAYLAGYSIFGGPQLDSSPLSRILRDWMPLMLSAAITAGIAPLLFLQILYREQFYTANLLLFTRWMAILPTLIVGFYLLYILKMKRISGWSIWLRGAVGLGAFGCFLFVGWSWVENHLLSVNHQVWQEQYAGGTLIYRPIELLPRLGLWFVAAFPTMSLMLAWQIWWEERIAGEPPQDRLPGTRRTATIALTALVLSCIFAGLYWQVMAVETRDVIFSNLAWPYIVLAMIGVLIEMVAWAIQYASGRLSLTWLTVGTVGLVINFVGTAVIRESTRLASLDIADLYGKHAESAKVGGLVVFLIFAVINVGLMLYCIRLTGRRADEKSASIGED